MRIREWQKKGTNPEAHAQSYAPQQRPLQQTAQRPMQQPLQAGEPGEPNGLYGKLVNKLSQAKNRVQQDLNPAHSDPRYHRPR